MRVWCSRPTLTRLLLAAGIGILPPALGWAQPTTTRVSVGSGGIQANNSSQVPAISADGRWVAFESVADNLVAGDTNAAYDVFVHDLLSGATTRVSLGPGGEQRNCSGRSAAISADGRWVAYVSQERNLVGACDAFGMFDVFLHDRDMGTTTRVSVAPGGAQANGVSLGTPAIGADGRWVAFRSGASNLVPGDTNGAEDVFVHDAQTNTTTRVSLGPSGAQANSYSGSPAISADGRWVAFTSEASNLVAGDTNGLPDVFVHDRQTGTTTRVSVGAGGTQGNGGSNSYGGSSAISGTGRWLAFTSEASNLVAGDTNGRADVFVHDLETGATSRVSVTSGGAQGECPSDRAVISADGRFVAFTSQRRNAAGICDLFGIFDVFLHDRLTATTTQVSLGPGGVQGNGPSLLPAINAEGRRIAFMSRAGNLVAGDTNNTEDVFVHDRGDPGCTFTLAPASAQAPGAGTTGRLLALGAAECAWTAVSNDPTWLALTSGASGTGLGMIDYAVAANPEAPRSGIIAIAGQTFTVEQADAATPMAPTGLLAHSVVGNTVTLRWTTPPVGPTPTGFLVEAGVNPGEVVASIPTGSAAPTFTITAPTGSFYVRVHALNGTFRSVASNEIRVHVNVPVTPSAPAHLLGVVNGSNVALTWTNTYEGGAPTSLTLDVSGVVVATIPLDVSDHAAFLNVPGGAWVGTTYRIGLRAQNAGGSSQRSSTLTLRVPTPCSGPPAVPTGMLAYLVGSTVYVDWTPGPSGAAPTSYVLDVTGTHVGQYATTGRTLSALLKPGSYTFTVTAVNPCGVSAATAPQTVVIP